MGRKRWGGKGGGKGEVGEKVSDTFSPPHLFSPTFSPRPNNMPVCPGALCPRRSPVASVPYENGS